MIALYYQTKVSIEFWYRHDSNLNLLFGYSLLARHYLKPITYSIFPFIPKKMIKKKKKLVFWMRWSNVRHFGNKPNKEFWLGTSLKKPVLVEQSVMFVFEAPNQSSIWGEKKKKYILILKDNCASNMTFLFIYFFYWVQFSTSAALKKEAQHTWMIHMLNLQ